MNNDLNEIKYILNDDLKYNQVIETAQEFPHIEGYTLKYLYNNYSLYSLIVETLIDRASFFLVRR